MNFKRDHKLRVRDDQEQLFCDALEVATAVLVSKLDMTNKITLRFERMGGWGGADAVHAGSWTPSRRLVKINFRNLYGCPLETYLKVLGHEFRHAMQDLHGVMDEVPSIEYAEGSVHYYNRRYYNQPREKDARKYEGVYAQMVMDDPVWLAAFGEHLSDVSGGERATLNDRKATMAHYGFTDEDEEHIKLFKDQEGALYWFDMRLTGAKRYTKAAFRKVWSEYRELLMTQPWTYVQRDATLMDLVC